MFARSGVSAVFLFLERAGSGVSAVFLFWGGRLVRVAVFGV